MDLWLIAATAATGYIVKYVQNVSESKDNFTESSEESFKVKPESPRLVNVKKPKEESFGERKIRTDGKGPAIQKLENTYGMEEASINGEGSGINEDVHSNSVVSLVPDFVENGDQNWPIHNLPVGDRQTNHFHEPFRLRTYLRGKQRGKRLIEPLDSLGSSFIKQFDREQMTMEEYMLSPFPSPCAPITRPLLVTDGTRVISRNSREYLSGHIQNDDMIAHVRGIPPLRKLQPSVESNKMRNKNGSGRCVRANGPNDAVVLLFVGISIGITSSFIARKIEVDKLQKALKQSEGLVQDLQDELEMKDSLTVRELEYENTKNNDLDGIFNGGTQCDQKAETSDSMSKIEAELEAELERLELNINTSNIETGHMSDLEPDYEIDFAQGELRTDKIKRQPFDETESNGDPNGNSTPESGNYVVSPRELCLRLQEVINSQLEQRIKELEMALQESQREVVRLHMEADSRKNSWSRVWGSHEVMRHEREREIPVDTDHTQNNPLETEPLVMNLTGEAVEAYNEAYDELVKINDESEDDSPSKMHDDERCREEGSLMEKRTPWRHECYMKDSSMMVKKVNFNMQELLDVVALSDEEEEEKSDFENEMEKELIKQIVEKTKQGSPVVLNAQKMLFLMEERE